MEITVPQYTGIKWRKHECSLSCFNGIVSAGLIAISVDAASSTTSSTSTSSNSSSFWGGVKSFVNETIAAEKMLDTYAMNTVGAYNPLAKTVTQTESDLLSSVSDLVKWKNSFWINGARVFCFVDCFRWSAASS